jgi:hypothetical protein
MPALRVTEGSDVFRSLFAAIEEQGERAGWLDLEAAEGAGGGELERARNDGPWKAVMVEPLRTVAVKSRRGPAVLRDLLREHFRGCRVVLVRGAAELPALRSLGSDWELVRLDGGVRRLTTAELVRALRSPHFAE